METRPIISYQTNRLTLRPTGIEDAAFILELLNSPDWIKHIGDRNVHTKEEAIHYIEERMLPQYQEKGYGNYTLIEHKNQDKVGTCGIYARPDVEDVDIGFSMLPQFMKKGYGYEAASKMMYLAEHEFGIKKITAITTYANIPSQNLIKKLGMKYIKDIELPNDNEILMQYGLTF